mmetsp:Transcript_21532/g.61615  ORF Transcript_21532/g.61615 Transcript_21532/m.61615 type:complete len:320 (-) Transcript_21532:3-962(-)
MPAASSPTGVASSIHVALGHGLVKCMFDIFRGHGRGGRLEDLASDAVHCGRHEVFDPTVPRVGRHALEGAGAGVAGEVRGSEAAPRAHAILVIRGVAILCPIQGLKLRRGWLQLQLAERLRRANLAQRRDGARIAGRRRHRRRPLLARRLVHANLVRRRRRNAGHIEGLRRRHRRAGRLEGRLVVNRRQVHGAELVLTVGKRASAWRQLAPPIVVTSAHASLGQVGPRAELRHRVGERTSFPLAAPRAEPAQARLLELRGLVDEGAAVLRGPRLPIIHVPIRSPMRWRLRTLDRAAHGVPSDWGQGGRQSSRIEKPKCT